MKNRVELIEKYLEELFPNPVCELNYKTDYELLIATVLSAQSTDKRVNASTDILFEKYPNLVSLKEAPLDDLEKIIRPVGSFRRKASYVKEISRRIDEEYNGVMPQEREVLESFPGVGRKTVNVVLSEYYGVPLIAVDTHVERVSKRLKLVYQKDNVEVIEQKLMKRFKKSTWSKRHLQLVLFGRYHCKAMKPECEDCKLTEICGYYQKKEK